MKNLFGNLKGDLFGGLTAGVVALPLALAFGVQSGLGAIAGLYGAMLIGFIASLFGGTNTQISGPTAPMTAVSMGIIAGIIQANDGVIENALPAILTVFVLAGLFQIILGVVKLGKYIKYIPYPVVSGFMTGIGVIILITQLLPALGYNAAQDEAFIESFNQQAQTNILQSAVEEQSQDGVLIITDLQTAINANATIDADRVRQESIALAKSSTSGVLGSLKYAPQAFKNINWTELILALITIFIIFGFKRITTAVPSTLVALLVVSIGAVALKLDVEKIGEIPSSLPLPNWEIFTEFSFGAISPYIFTAIALALLGAIDSLLTSVVADNMTKTSHNPNKELVGQGIGNTVAAIFGGIPGAGATIRTVVNINSGGKSKLSGMIAAILIFIIVIALGGYASEIPNAVLAGILITVGIGVMDTKGLKALRSIPKSDVVIMFVVLLLTVFWDLVYAVGIGLVIASLIFMKKMGDHTASNSRVATLDEDDDLDHADYSRIPVELREEVVIKELRGPLFFGNTKDFQSLSLQTPVRATHAIIRMEEVPFIDQSGLFAFEDVLTDLVRKNIQPLLVGVNEQPQYRMEAIDIIPDLIHEEFLFDDYDTCLNYVTTNVKDTVPPRVRA